MQRMTTEGAFPVAVEKRAYRKVASQPPLWDGPRCVLGGASATWNMQRDSQPLRQRLFPLQQVDNVAVTVGEEHQRVATLLLRLRQE